MPRPRYRRNFSKRPRSFAMETTVFHPRDHGLLPKRPRSLLLILPIPGVGRVCERVSDRVDRSPRRPPTFARPQGFALYIRRRERVFWETRRKMEGAGADDIHLPDRTVGRSRGAPDRRDSRADEKNSHGHKKGVVAGVKMSVSLRFQSESIAKQADIS